MPKTYEGMTNVIQCRFEELKWSKAFLKIPQKNRSYALYHLFLNSPTAGDPTIPDIPTDLGPGEMVVDILLMRTKETLCRVIVPPDAMSDFRQFQNLVFKSRFSAGL